MSSFTSEDEFEDPNVKRKRREFNLALSDLTAINNPVEQEKQKAQYEEIRVSTARIMADPANGRYSRGPEERRYIIDDLDAGSHLLILEHNPIKDAKCSAYFCLLRNHQNERDGKIRSQYRFKLRRQDTRPIPPPTTCSGKSQVLSHLMPRGDRLVSTTVCRSAVGRSRLSLLPLREHGRSMRLPSRNSRLGQVGRESIRCVHV